MKDQQAIKGGAVCRARVGARVQRRSSVPILVLVTGAVASVLGAAGPTATSYQAVDLNPAGLTETWASGVGGGQQVGSGVCPDGTQHALVWKGDAVGVVDLNTFLPTGFTNSEATGIDAGGNIVGHAWSSGEDHHAFLWEPQ